MSSNPKWQRAGNLKAINFSIHCYYSMLFLPLPVKFGFLASFQTIQHQLVVRVEVPFKWFIKLDKCLV